MKARITRLLEIIATVLLLGTQTVLNAGVAISIMTLPLLPLIADYLIRISPSSLEILSFELWTMTVDSTFLVGRIIALIGVIVFLVAAGEWFRNHRKKIGLFKTGLYSKMRHPQFTGIVITTLGLTIMTLTNGVSIYLPKTNFFNFNIPKLVGLWFLQVLGYIVIAEYEDWRLSKKYSDEHLEYKHKVPLLYPIKNPKKIPELYFSIIITGIICIILLLLPYDLIRVYSSKLYYF